MPNDGFPQQVSGTAEFLLALADDELCIGQNHSWWIAVGPFLEEDLAFVSIAQDELGHARALFGLLADNAAQNSQVDQLAYLRQPDQYRSTHLVEMPCHDWAYAMARHYLYDTAEAVRWAALADSSWQELGAVARRAQAEERIHENHARSLLQRLLSTQGGQDNLQDVMTELAPLAVGLFDAPVGCDDSELLAAGVIGSSLEEQCNQWISRVAEDVAPYGADGFVETLKEAAAGRSASRNSGSSANSELVDPGRLGKRSSHFEALHHEMVEVLEIDPTATW